ncbi:hypothetical protein JNW88_08925 [Micromonospora sp. ATA32]|nr:hypothetical protein [Micromonospora sp. ATA32]
MAMVNLPAARRHHRSRIAYALGLLALIGAATTMVVVVRYPALSSTQLNPPVPAPEITVAGQSAPPDEPGWPGYPDASATSVHPRSARAPQRPRPARRTVRRGNGSGTMVEPPRRPGGTSGVSASDQLSRSLFYSGILGLAISLAGLGLVGTRRRMW